MLYTIFFSDEYFHGGELQVTVNGTFTSVEDFVQLLIALAANIGRQLIVDTGFKGLVEQWDKRRWHIHEFDSAWMLDPPDKIYICSHSEDDSNFFDATSKPGVARQVAEKHFNNLVRWHTAGVSNT